MEIIHGNGQSISHVYDPIGHRVGERIDNYLIEDYSGFLNLQERKGSGPRLNAVICLSDKGLKKKLFKQLEGSTNIVNAIHPSATISKAAKLGKGNIVKS